jgi:hypothetical protein
MVDDSSPYDFEHWHSCDKHFHYATLLTNHHSQYISVMLVYDTSHSVRQADIKKKKKSHCRMHYL